MLRCTLVKPSVFRASHTAWLVPSDRPSLPRRSFNRFVKASTFAKLFGIVVVPSILFSSYLLLCNTVCDAFDEGYDAMYIDREVDTSLLSTDVIYLIEDWEGRVRRQLCVGDVIMYMGTDVQSDDYVKGQYAATGMRPGAHKYSNIGVIVKAYDAKANKGPYMLEVSRNREGLLDWKGVLRRDCAMVVDCGERLSAHCVMNKARTVVMGLGEAEEAFAAIQRAEEELSISLSSPSSSPTMTVADPTAEHRAALEAQLVEQYVRDHPLEPIVPRPFPSYKRAAYRRVVTEGGVSPTSLLSPSEMETFRQSVEAFAEVFEGAPMDLLHLPEALRGVGGGGGVGVSNKNDTAAAASPSPSPLAADPRAQKLYSEMKAMRASLLSSSSASSSSSSPLSSSLSSPSFTDDDVDAKFSTRLYNSFYSMAAMTVMNLRSYEGYYRRKRAVEEKRLWREEQQQQVTSSPSTANKYTHLVSPAELVQNFYECVGFSTVKQKGKRVDVVEIASPSHSASSSGLGGGHTRNSAVLSNSSYFSFHHLTTMAATMLAMISGPSSNNDSSSTEVADAATPSTTTTTTNTVSLSSPSTSSSLSSFSSLFSSYEAKKAAYLEKRRMEHLKNSPSGVIGEGGNTAHHPPAASSSDADNSLSSYPLTSAALITHPKAFSYEHNCKLFPTHFSNLMNFYENYDSKTVDIISENERKALGVEDHLLFSLKEDRKAAAQAKEDSSLMNLLNSGHSGNRLKRQREKAEAEAAVAEAEATAARRYANTSGSGDAASSGGGSGIISLASRRLNSYQSDVAAARLVAEKARMRSALRLAPDFALTPEGRIKIEKWNARWEWRSSERERVKTRAMLEKRAERQKAEGKFRAAEIAKAEAEAERLAGERRRQGN